MEKKLLQFIKLTWDTLMYTREIRPSEFWWSMLKNKENLSTFK